VPAGLLIHGPQKHRPPEHRAGTEVSRRRRLPHVIPSRIAVPGIAADRRRTLVDLWTALYHSAASEELSDPEREMISPTSSTRHASSRSGR
jgi:hypothetical protein